MKNTFAPRTVRALAPFLAATALVSIPAFAQDAAPQTAPAQPAISTPPSSATVAIPPIARTVPDGATPVAEAAESAKPAPRVATATRSTNRVTRNTVTRTAPAAAVAAKPQSIAPVAVAPAAPVVSPAVAPPAPVAAPANEPVTSSADTASTQSTTTAAAIPLWAWLAGGIAILAVILGAALAMRRRREVYHYDEPAYVDAADVEPVPVAVAPVIDREPVPVAKAEPRKQPEYLRTAAPLATPPMETVIAAPDAVEMSTPPADEVAELTAGTAPIAERPWLEFAMRPVRAGTNVDEALVEIELTVGNAGTVDARDVRISTFLLSGDVRNSEMERLLVNPPSDATTDPVTIKPGEGKRIDATLALLKSDMGEVLPDAIRPIVVADARYTLADGSEGRTSASFVIGVTTEEGNVLEPLELNRSSMHENVAAELLGEPQHA